MRITDTQILKTERYNTGTSYSKMHTLGVLRFEKLSKKPVAPAGYKNKQTVSRRRYLARVLSSLMYRYALRQERIVLKYERAAFLIPCQGLRGFDSISLLTLNLLNQIIAHNLLLYLRISLRLQIIAQIGHSLIHCFRNELR